MWYKVMTGRCSHVGSAPNLKFGIQFSAIRHGSRFNYFIGRRTPVGDSDCSDLLL